MRSLLRVLPPGTPAVGSGLVVLGLASYVHLAVAGHRLDPASMSSVAVLWSIVYAIGPGLFFAIEQEITRHTATRRVGAEPAGPVLARGAVLALGVLAAIVVVVVTASQWLAEHLFHGDRAMVWALCGALAGLAVAHTTRGVLAGTGRFGWYGGQLGLDGAFRIVLATVLGLAGATSAVWFSLILTVAPIASVLLTLAPVLGEVAPGRPVGWAEFSRGLGLLTVSSLLAQVLINVPVISAALLAPGDAALAGAVLSAMVLVRIPVFVFASLQAALLAGLATAAAEPNPPVFHRLLVRTAGVVAALGGAGAIVMIVAGGWLAVNLFDSPARLGVVDFAVLSVGTLAYLLALVLGQGLQAVRRHRDQALAWIAGLVVMVVTTMMPGGPSVKVVGAYAAGAVTVAAAMAVLLVRRTPVYWATVQAGAAAAAAARAGRGD